MDRYVFSRNDWPALADAAAVSVAATVFFQMWRTRADPYNRFADGDVVYIGDTSTRRLIWETRVTNLIDDFGYRTTRQALHALRSAYGLYAADLNDYHRQRDGHGWLLAWAPQVMRRIDVRLPPGFRFGQNGYRRIEPGDATLLGLPAPATRRPLASPPDWYDPTAAGRGALRVVPRYIPMHVRETVARRDRYRCVGCGTTVNLHFDHILPHAHGGPSTVENLRLLCAASNLARGAGTPGDVPRCAADGPRVRTDNRAATRSKRG